MTMVSLPNILFQVGEVDVGDLEFIQEKVIAGDYFQVSGDINNLNDTIEFIVPNGRTAFMIEAKIVQTGHVSPAVNSTSGVTTTTKNAVQADLKIDTITKDKANVGMSSVDRVIGGGGSGSSTNHNSDPFNVSGLSLVGDGVKKIEIENTLDDGSAFATMSGYLV